MKFIFHENVKFKLKNLKFKKNQYYEINLYHQQHKVIEEVDKIQLMMMMPLSILLLLLVLVLPPLLLSWLLLSLSLSMMMILLLY